MTNKIRLLVLATLLILITSGCANSQIFSLPVELVKVPQLQLTDGRETELTKAKTLSLNISNCAYGIYRVGDAQLQPDRITYLNQRLAGGLPERYENAALVLDKFDIYMNRQASLRGIASVVRPGGLIGDALLERACAVEGAMDGGYEASENPNGRDAFITTLILSIDGEIYASRGLALKESLADGVADNSQNRSASSAKSMQQSIDLAIDKIIGQAGRASDPIPAR